VTMTRWVPSSRLESQLAKARRTLDRGHQQRSAIRSPNVMLSVSIAPLPVRGGIHRRRPSIVSAIRCRAHRRNLPGRRCSPGCRRRRPRIRVSIAGPARSPKRAWRPPVEIPTAPSVSMISEACTCGSDVGRGLAVGGEDYGGLFRSWIGGMTTRPGAPCRPSCPGTGITHIWIAAVVSFCHVEAHNASKRLYGRPA